MPAKLVKIDAANLAVKNGERCVAEREDGLKRLQDAHHDTTMAEIMLATARSELAKCERELDDLDKAE